MNYLDKICVLLLLKAVLAKANSPDDCFSIKIENITGFNEIAAKIDRLCHCIMYEKNKDIHLNKNCSDTADKKDLSPILYDNLKDLCKLIFWPVHKAIKDSNSGNCSCMNLCTVKRVNNTNNNGSAVNNKFDLEFINSTHGNVIHRSERRSSDDSEDNINFDEESDESNPSEPDDNPDDNYRNHNTTSSYDSVYHPMSNNSNASISSITDLNSGIYKNDTTKDHNGSTLISNSSIDSVSVRNETIDHKLTDSPNQNEISKNSTVTSNTMIRTTQQTNNDLQLLYNSVVDTRKDVEVNKDAKISNSSDKENLKTNFDTFFIANYTTIEGSIITSTVTQETTTTKNSLRAAVPVRPASSRKTHDERYSLSTVLWTVFVAFTAGLLAAVALKAIFNLYHSKSYELPPEQDA